MIRYQIIYSYIVSLIRLIERVLPKKRKAYTSTCPQDNPKAVNLCALNLVDTKIPIIYFLSIFLHFYHALEITLRGNVLLAHKYISCVCDVLVNAIKTSPCGIAEWESRTPSYTEPHVEGEWKIIKPILFISARGEHPPLNLKKCTSSGSRSDQCLRALVKIMLNDTFLQPPPSSNFHQCHGKTAYDDINCLRSPRGNISLVDLLFARTYYNPYVARKELDVAFATVPGNLWTIEFSVMVL